MPVETLKWNENGLDIIDQRFLPLQEKRVILTSLAEVCEAIETLAVRGAPAIGVAAAYGVVVAACEKTTREHVLSAIGRLRRTRPTAVNLFIALDCMQGIVEDAFSTGDPVKVLLEKAHALYDDDQRTCRALSLHGAELLSDGDTVLTHCNAGGLATTGYGTALGVIYAAVEQGKRIKVFADETRPLLQGARLTAWELKKSGIPVTVICDSMAGDVLRRGWINHVIVGADRIASNGDTANKIGTFGLSVLSRAYEIPLYVAAPLTSFDFSLPSGDSIPIEERKESEISFIAGKQVAPDGVSFYNPSFDITPARNISAIISEMGVARSPFTPTLQLWSTVRNNRN
jgi:methylthioribose-1-phosphate isomerase